MCNQKIEKLVVWLFATISYALNPFLKVELGVETIVGAKKEPS
jgi:hypothetical protein